MGYYTDYEITITEGNGSHLPILCQRIIAISEYDFHIEEDKIIHNEPIKWYSYDSDMKEISKEFPKLQITVKGEGEESGDIWKQIYKNGESRRIDAEILFPE